MAEPSHDGVPVPCGPKKREPKFNLKKISEVPTSPLPSISSSALNVASVSGPESAAGPSSFPVLCQPAASSKSECDEPLVPGLGNLSSLSGHVPAEPSHDGLPVLCGRGKRMTKLSLKNVSEVPTSAVPSVSCSVSAPESAENEPCTQDADDEDVVITEMCGPRRRTAERLSVKKAKKCPHELVIMRDGLRRKQCLEDNHIDHFSAMLQEQFQTVDGFQRVSVFEDGVTYWIGTPSDKFVQILNTDRNHWITVSNLRCDFPGQVKIYDSIYNAFTASSRNAKMQQIAWMLHTDAPRITFQWQDVQRQMGNKACGLYALANAYALCAGTNPEDYAWDQGKLWGHFMHSLSTGTGSVKLPPVTGTRSGRGVVNTVTLPVYCVCRQPHLRSRFMIQCQSCKEWFYRRCQKVPAIVDETTVFPCSRCSS